MAKTVIVDGLHFEQVQEVLKKQHACYVLITCDKPNAEGDMKARLMYEGDESLASYLIDQAQQMLSDESERRLESK